MQALQWPSENHRRHSSARRYKKDIGLSRTPKPRSTASPGDSRSQFRNFLNARTGFVCPDSCIFPLNFIQNTRNSPHLSALCPKAASGQNPASNISQHNELKRDMERDYSSRLALMLSMLSKGVAGFTQYRITRLASRQSMFRHV